MAACRMDPVAIALALSACAAPGRLKHRTASTVRPDDTKRAIAFRIGVTPCRSEKWDARPAPTDSGRAAPGQCAGQTYRGKGGARDVRALSSCSNPRGSCGIARRSGGDDYFTKPFDLSRVKDQLRRDRNRRVKGSVHGTERCEHPVHSLRRRPLVRWHLEMQSDVNLPDDEDLVCRLLDFPNRLTGQTISVRPDVARLQRAPEGPRQSAGGRGDDIL